MSVSAAFGDVRRIAHGPTRTLFIGLLVKSDRERVDPLADHGLPRRRCAHFPVLTATALLAWQARR